MTSNNGLYDINKDKYDVKERCIWHQTMIYMTSN